MARIFTTRFEFNKQYYSAIVYLMAKNGERLVRVKVLDPALQQLLPEGDLEYKGNGNFSYPAPYTRISITLLQSISRAVDAYMEVDI